MIDLDQIHPAVIGLGYVGLPLAVEMARYWPTVGFDISDSRIERLRNGYDETGEVDREHLLQATNLNLSSNAGSLGVCNTYVVTVPTPIDEHQRPDLGPLIAACRTVRAALSSGDLVIFESTVYPGATEEVCVPELERASGLTYNRDFFVGYSPERMNPGDKNHTVTDIAKVTSGSTPAAGELVDKLYGRLVPAGTHRASSIRVAEAAKVIENTQRDLNIAFVNELAIIFNRLGIDTTEVLEAAGTKWNFLPFRPGLVGGHCIGVDPYYLTHKAQEIKYHPEIILAGRRLNDNMGGYVASELVKLMIKRGIAVSGARVLVLGITFKENCPDIRNTRVIDVVRELQEYGCHVDVYDPWADSTEVNSSYGLDLLAEPDRDGSYDACLLAVAHRQFGDMSPRELVGPQGSVYDVKSFWPREQVDRRL